MTIILRLQGLDVKAGTEDIRTFFQGLHIPDGGVYIVGGSLREAFIAFTTERDAQRAMRYTENFLKGSKVYLHISCMAELEQKLESLLKRKKPSPTQRTVKKPPTSPDANVLPLSACPLNPNTANLPQLLNPDDANTQPLNVESLDANTAFLLGICTVLQGLQSSIQSENKEAEQGVDFSKADGAVAFDEVRTPKMDPRSGYVKLFGLPASATKELVCQFFEGLTVQEVIVNVSLGHRRGCLVKFANMQDACEALLFNQKSLGSICVDVRGANEKLWTSALQECETAFDVGERVKLKQIPHGGTANHNQKNMSALRLKRQSAHQMPFKSLKKPRPDGDLTTNVSPNTEYVVKVGNIPKNMTKTEIKELFGCPNIAHTNVQHLLDEEGIRTETAFLIFNCTEDYEYAMNLSGCHVGSDAIQVSSITKKMMWDMLAKTHHGNLKHGTKANAKKKPDRTRKSNPVETPEEAPGMNPDPAAQTCLFVRNMPANVQKSHINRLFYKYKVGEENIVLLHDFDGRGIGEAVVRFKSQKLATLAQRLHGLDFLGTKVLLTLINEKQMEDILTRTV